MCLYYYSKRDLSLQQKRPEAVCLDVFNAFNEGQREFNAFHQGQHAAWAGPESCSKRPAGTDMRPDPGHSPVSGGACQDHLRMYSGHVKGCIRDMREEHMRGV